ncbi:hypothetical protein F5148DRAFT_1274418 [Russula earlei]|uniref:Uncharacterized protein n=1 Tax=Russula earlei TaxID=71964 RepID=A0ACC0UHR5_9AGAM|nr:hypothetical protein F5148DRAFT_1274418 [Russula earlei]
MSTSGLKAIAPVPTAADFLDIVLSKTQRKTPTVIHKNFKISRIRNFYMRKVKFTQDSFDEKLSAILSEFPMLDDLHPFLSSLMNVLYDKNHYKLALGQLRTARHLIDHVAKDYVRLLKFGDSFVPVVPDGTQNLIHRMATVMRRQKDPLAYLEQVRQHISRLPAIDPNTRTLLICGYPNVGKSSFINKVTRADVDVQPYAFTTKSLFVGHLDYKYLRWQEMNTIEMQSITALAHLKSCVLYFMDLSEQCGYIPSKHRYCKLFHSIKPLFAGKPTILVINKIGCYTPRRPYPRITDRLCKRSLTLRGVQCVQVSCYSEEGVMDLKNKACDALLAQRVDAKLKGNKIDTIINRIHVAQPKPRDDVVREPFIPETVKLRKRYNKNDPDRRKLERDIELEEGGAGVYNVNLKKDYMLASDEWKNDVIPEIMDGKNIADFIDPDIAEKLEALEREEEMLEAEGYYDEHEEMFDSEDEREATAKKNARRPQARGTEQKKMKNKARLSTHGGPSHADRLDGRPDPSGHRPEPPARAREKGETMMDVDGGEGPGTRQKRSKANSGAVIMRKHARAPRSNRQLAGLRDEAQASRAARLRNLGQRGRNMLAKAGESDRAIRVKMPKHLFSGKRKGGKTNRR